MAQARTAANHALCIRACSKGAFGDITQLSAISAFASSRQGETGWYPSSCCKKLCRHNYGSVRRGPVDHMLRPSAST